MVHQLLHSILFYSIQPADTLSLLPRSLLGLARRCCPPLVVLEPELPRDRAALLLLVGGQGLEDHAQLILRSSERASGLLEMRLAGCLGEVCAVGWLRRRLLCSR